MSIGNAVYPPGWMQITTNICVANAAVANITLWAPNPGNYAGISVNVPTNQIVAIDSNFLSVWQNANSGTVVSNQIIVMP